MSTTPAAILDVAFQKAEALMGQSIIVSPSISEKIDYVSRYVGNRAVVRLLLACSLAAIHRPELEAHNAADQQTGSLGDMEITLIDDQKIITSYEMKTRRVTVEDIDRALQKINSTGKRVDNYIFVTTDVIRHLRNSNVLW